VPFSKIGEGVGRLNTTGLLATFGASTNTGKCLEIAL